MAYTYPVKWITSSMRGAPPISGTPGSFVAALDAFLNTGWGAANAITVSVSGGVGTAQFADGVFFEDHAVVLFGGATTPAALNGEARVLSHTNNSITFETDAPDGVATTGTAITCRYAPVGGWEKKYSGTNLAAYKSTDGQAHGHFWRVDDTGTTAARMVGYETMTDVNTGSGAFPTAAYIAGGGYVYKSVVASAAAARYSLAADSRTVLLGLEPGTSSVATNRSANIRGFGDAIALAASGDVWASFCSFTGSNLGVFNVGALSGGPTSNSSGFSCFPRAYSGLGASVVGEVSPFSGTAGTMSGADSYMGAAPSVVDGQIKLSKVFIKESGNNPARAIAPGVVYVPQTGIAGLVSGGDIALGAGDFSGRRLMAVLCGPSPNSPPTAAAFLDITGPWR